MVPEPFDRLRNHLSKDSMSATLITFGTVPLCKEIIKIFLVRGSAGTIFPYNANAFAGLVLVAHRALLANAQARFFILWYIDFLLI